MIIQVKGEGRQIDGLLVDASQIKDPYDFLSLLYRKNLKWQFLFDEKSDTDTSCLWGEATVKVYIENAIAKNKQIIFGRIPISSYSHYVEVRSKHFKESVLQLEITEYDENIVIQPI